MTCMCCTHDQIFHGSHGCTAGESSSNPCKCPGYEEAPCPHGAVSAVTCRQCGAVVEEGRECYATPMCHACLPPPPPLPIRRKCRCCIHDEHIGMCHGRNGGTAYVCPCFHSSASASR